MANDLEGLGRFLGDLPRQWGAIAEKDREVSREQGVRILRLGVPVRTGFLRSTVQIQGESWGATAFYAPYVDGFWRAGRQSTNRAIEKYFPKRGYRRVGR